MAALKLVASKLEITQDAQSRRALAVPPSPPPGPPGPPKWKPPHIGLVLQRFISEKQTPEKLAVFMCKDVSQARMLLAGRMRITPSLATALSGFTGMSAMFFVNLQARYDRDFPKTGLHIPHPV